ncbi:MAG: gliding motility protein [Planctomycetes bacterium]|nr:gliding motility protein [Planctomycetota bacterium]
MANGAHSELIPIPPGARGAALAELAVWVRALAQPEASREAAVEALARLAQWVTERDEVLALGLPGFEARACDRALPRVRRLHVLLELAEGSRELRELFAHALERVMADADGLSLFAEGGLPNDRGILDETSDRLARRFLPRPRGEHDLAVLLTRFFDDAGDADWLADLPRELFERALRVFAVGAHAREHLLEAHAEALYLLAARVETLGISEAMRARQSAKRLRGSCWSRLPRATERVLAAPRAERSVAEWRADIEACRAATREVLEHLESTGVSVDLVYSIDVIERALERMLLLHALLVDRSPERLQAALAEFVRVRHADTSLVSLARENMRLLARKVVERAGQTGEHYITTTRRDYAAMWGSAVVGGLVTVGTAALKTVVALRHFPLALEGFLSGLNYALSFVLIGHVGGTLATKQPSMTGAALADVIDRSSGDERAEALVTHIARIVRSQLAAAFGNVLAVGVGAYAFDRLWLGARGTHYLDRAGVDYVLHSFDPLKSGTVFYAALTGVILWLSSLLGGAIENWAVYRQVPRGIAEHRLGHTLGRARLAACAAFVERHLASWSTSIVLGFMLGFTPVLGKFTGLPLDVRHVTLSMGQLCLALSELGPSVFGDARAAWALSGIALTFVLNLAVSFGLALRVALRARGASASDRSSIVAALRRRLLRRPHEFLVPAREAQGSAAHRSH